jgi:hypothetical protein
MASSENVEKRTSIGQQQQQQQQEQMQISQDKQHSKEKIQTATLNLKGKLISNAVSSFVDCIVF